jgi:hypothetical protein
VLDLLLLAVPISFFAIAALYVRGCARIVAHREDER